MVAGVVVVVGGVKANWGKTLAAGEMVGVLVGNDGVEVKAVCSAASVLAASVENWAIWMVKV